MIVVKIDEISIHIGGGLAGDILQAVCEQLSKDPSHHRLVDKNGIQAIVCDEMHSPYFLAHHSAVAQPMSAGADQDSLSARHQRLHAAMQEARSNPSKRPRLISGSTAFLLWLNFDL